MIYEIRILCVEYIGYDAPIIKNQTLKTRVSQGLQTLYTRLEDSRIN